jgi:hypothetical protein
VDNKGSKSEKENNAYNLPSISQTVKYLHAGIKAIKAGNFSTWPIMTPTTVKRTHEEKASGSMINERDSRKCKQTQHTSRDIYIEIPNATETMHSKGTDSPQLQAKGTTTPWC